ncbi:MAG TPA: hypothetical protein VF232_13145 [Gaiellaceae bacterium]
MRHMLSSQTGVRCNLGTIATILGASLIVGLSLLAGNGSAGLANKPRGSTALPKTPNACNHNGVTCRWNVTIVAESHESDESRKMDADWAVTYKNLLLGLPTAAQLALSENEPEGDVIHMGYNGKGATAGKISFTQSTPGGPNCSWTQSYRVPTLVAVNTHLKLLHPIRRGLPWSFNVVSYYNRDVGLTGDYCEQGNTEAIELGMPQSQCCRLGGPPITEISFEPFFTTRLEIDYLTKLRRLPFPWTKFWAGRSVTVSKKWRVAPVPGTVQSGRVTITFTRR